MNLDKVPKKYAGLDGTEIAISESQERMAVVVAPQDVEQFLAYAKEENLEAIEVAVVTEEPRLILEWRGKDIVNISRAFLDTNGAHQEADVEVEMPKEEDNFFKKIELPKVADALQKTTTNQHGLPCLRILMYVPRRDLSRCLTVPSVREVSTCHTAAAIS